MPISIKKLYYDFAFVVKKIKSAMRISIYTNMIYGLALLQKKMYLMKKNRKKAQCWFFLFNACLN